MSALPVPPDSYSSEPREDGVYSGYRLLERVSQGPFSEVWRASFSDGTLAALKFARGPHGARMLEDEAEVTRRLASRSHSVVCARGLYVEGHPELTGDRPYLVLPWLAGGTLRERIRELESADDRARGAKLMIQLTEAMGQIHRSGVIHGDLKPENVLLDERGRPHLIDFGLAKQLRSARLGQSLRQSLKTDDELVGGTLAYMPPEAVKGGEATRQSDVYALGVMLHEVLLGRRPDKATSPDELRALLPEAVVDLLLEALASEPQDRLRDAGVLAQRLRACEDALTAVGARRRLQRVTRFVLGGLAALFVGIRYLSVALLLSSYAAIAVGALVGLFVAGPFALLSLILFLPIGLVHMTVRWEGPETNDEYQARQGGLVARR